jgi:hypothetical protein
LSAQFSNDEWKLSAHIRYFTSVPLALQLRTMNLNICGTIQTNRVGFDKAVVWPFKQARLRTVERGSSKTSLSSDVPGLACTGWVDNRPVYFLSTGTSTAPTTVQRKNKTGGRDAVPCPAVVDQYNRYMGGVDRHDQLRLQRYSVQLATRFTKYYKSLFLAMVCV